jgi:hypothetical protein
MFLYFRVNVQSSALHIRLITATCILQSTVYKWTKAVALHVVKRGLAVSSPSHMLPSRVLIVKWRRWLS